ncbi:hypothetical protein [Legionella clemsonensis]|uniref:Lipoprotein n=1 Tax=Legionella clemsonensis TaxID=1867846 RepID=A0A222P621_9GAMM|nr:hypothetical protein [Legionella clemsonensis]ASQ47257.1 hypothetical protein clem_13650 [Legionella clemsonensis]
MKKLIIACLLFVPSLLLSSCTVTTANYYPAGYRNDFIYSVGYYGYRPYWGTRAYTGYRWPGYWGYRGIYSYPRAWYGYVRRW